MKLSPRIKDDDDFKTFMAEYRSRISREGTPDAERREIMQRANPRYVLRNWMAQVSREKFHFLVMDENF